MATERDSDAAVVIGPASIMMSHCMDDTGQHCYDFPRPAVTVDIALFREASDGWSILLVRRKKEPFEGSWALPGGFVDEMEPLEEAARRELKEETGLDAPRLLQMGAYGDPGRDPRGHTVSIVWVGLDRGGEDPRGSDDAAEAAWTAVSDLPRMAFDHDRIVSDAIAWLERNRSELEERGASRG
jgi:8-oxo-dGTP diphosphatase